MSTYNRSQLAPQYPVFSRRGMTDEPNHFGPPDMWPSGFGPGYSVYASAHGRNLAGMGDSGFDARNAEGIENYPNELNLLGIADDVEGNGVFDPHGSHGNVHPDAGVFQDHVNLPGYVARDVPFTVSEVTDLTHAGGQVAYVPGGAVAFHQGQAETFGQNADLLWQIPPGMGYEAGMIDGEGSVEPPTATWNVRSGMGAVEAPADNTNRNYMIAVGAGLAVGLGIVLLVGKKRR